jgi:hypothetical protein
MRLREGHGRMDWKFAMTFDFLKRWFFSGAGKSIARNMIGDDRAVPSDPLTSRNDGITGLSRHF